MDDGAGSCRRFPDGEEGSLDKLLKDVFFDLVYFLYGYTHDVHAAEDLAMDTVADHLARPERYDGRASLKTYLFMRGRSRALNHLRRGRILPFASLSEAEELPDEREDLEEKVLQGERRRAVAAAMAKLPPDMREAVHLVYFEQMSYAEAAAVMKKDRKQIDNLLVRAREKLRTILGKEGEQLL